MKSDLGRWSFFMVRFLNESIHNVFGASLGLNRMWTKKNYDHAPKSGCADFFNICPKRAVLKNIQVWPFSCLLMASLCLLLLDVSKMWLADFLTTFFTNKVSDLIWTCMFNVIYMWRVSPCVVHWALFATRFLSRGRVVSGDISGHNLSRSQCFQVQPVTCWDLSVFLYWGY